MDGQRLRAPQRLERGAPDRWHSQRLINKNTNETRMSQNENYIRYKRKSRQVYYWPCKLYVPVTLKVKNRFAEVARRELLSQAELGAVVVMHYLEHQALLLEAIHAYRQEKAAEPFSLHLDTLKELSDD